MYCFFGFWYDAMVSYTGVLWITVGIFACVSALFLSLGRYPDLPTHTDTKSAPPR